MKHEVHAIVWKIAEDKQIEIKWNFAEMYNYTLIACSDLFPLLLAETEQFSIDAILSHAQSTIANTFMKE